jgi:hypothetical protein
MAIKRPGAYVPLAVNYADDEAIMDAGEDAELMYLRILAFCGRTPKTEGWISDKQIRTRLGLELRPEIGPETAPEKRAERLAEVGLLTREGCGYRVGSWLRWNRSAEEVARTQGQDRERKKPLTSTVTGNGTGKRTGNKTGTDTGFQHPDTDTETETETDTYKSEAAEATPDEANRQAVERLCTRLADHIETNTGKRPTITKTWRDSTRLMLGKDKRTEYQIGWIIDWCQADEFWRSNILSMPKLRDKFDQLVLKSDARARSHLRVAPNGANGHQGPVNGYGEPIFIGLAPDDKR